WPSLYASRVARIQSSDVREQARLMGQADIISFGGGIPDPAVFPYAAIAEAAHCAPIFRKRRLAAPQGMARRLHGVAWAGLRPGQYPDHLRLPAGPGPDRPAV